MGNIFSRMAAADRHYWRITSHIARTSGLADARTHYDSRGFVALNLSLCCLRRLGEVIHLTEIKRRKAS